MEKKKRKNQFDSILILSLENRRADTSSDVEKSTSGGKLPARKCFSPTRRNVLAKALVVRVEREEINWKTSQFGVFPERENIPTKHCLERKIASFLTVLLFVFPMTSSEDIEKKRKKKASGNFHFYPSALFFDVSRTKSYLKRKSDTRHDSWQRTILKIFLLLSKFSAFFLV